MPHFSTRSTQNLATCDPRLEDLFKYIIKHYNCTILCGYRNEADQRSAVAAGASKLQWPHSKHNILPALAVDVVPYPVDWDDMKRWYHFAGFVLGVALEKGIPIRWGGDWDGDHKFTDQTFHDLPHWETIYPCI